MRLSRAVVFVLFLTAMAGATAPAPRAAVVAPPPAAAVGQGFGEILACAACIAGGVILVSQGPGAIFVAAHTPGSAVVVAGCIAACSAALS